MPIACALGVLGVVALNAYRAVSLVRPPRTPVDPSAIERALPESVPVSFLGAQGALLQGNLIYPKNGAALVLVHGLFANRTQLLDEARLFASHGYGVLIYDNRAHGESGGTTATWGQVEANDTRYAVDFLKAQTNVVDGKVGLFGFSIGGTAVLREAANDGRIGAVVVESTYSSMRGEIDYMYSRYGLLSQLPARWVAQWLGGLDYSELVGEKLVCGLQSRPLLLVYGTDDADVPASEGQRMADAACNSTSLLMIEADTHGGYMEANATLYSERLLAFFDHALL